MPHPAPAHDPTGARLTLDLDALAANRARIAEACAGAEVAAVVKADAYGLGVGPVGRRLHSEGVRSFFVARLAEGEALRRELGGRPADIYVLDGLTIGAAARFEAAGLIPVLSSVPQVQAAVARAQQGGFRAALQVDTGMNRQGLPLPEFAALLAAPRGGLGELDVRLLMSHLGSASTPGDPRNAAQRAAFAQACALMPDVRTSLAASAGAFLDPSFHGALVRAGVSLYGGGPEERPDAGLRAVATLTAPVLDIRRLETGDRVGYGEMYTARRPMRVAVLAAGYADGFIRAASGRASVWLGGALRPVLVVNMDLMVVDIGDSQVAPGDAAELLGPHALLDDLAAAAGTVAHEILVRLSARAERTYLGAV